MPKIPKTKVNWTSRDVHAGLCKIMFHLQYGKTNQFNGITPGKPELFMKKPLRIQKGKVYELVG